MDYAFGTEPYDHQREDFLRSRDERVFAILSQMGTGKSKIVVDTAAWLFVRGRARAVAVVAPNGVHRKWIEHEFPTHLPTYVPRVAWAWRTPQRVADRRLVDRILRPADPDFLRVVAFNYEAFRNATAPAARLLRTILRAVPTLLVLDESVYVKTPGAKRTKVLHSLGRDAAYRRILSGLPVPESPWDAWSQFRFLDPELLGHQTFASFRAHYADMLGPGDPQFDRLIEQLARRTGKGIEFYRRFPPPLVRVDREGRRMWRNLGELRRRIAPVSVRRRKEDCLDLPPKTYVTRETRFGGEQAEIYERVFEDARVALGVDLHAEVERLVRAPGTVLDHVLKRITRLRQVLGGHFVTDDGAVTPLECPRVDDVVAAVSEESGKVIVWCAFVPEVLRIAAALTEAGRVVVRYHGSVSPDERVANVARFQTGDADAFVGTPQSGGIGLDLFAASSVFYYTNSYSANVRAQSEDRAHRIGQVNPVTVVDMIVPGRIDEVVLRSLRAKNEMSEEVLDGQR